MYNPIIPVKNQTISSTSIPTCNARDLHQFLDVGKMFAHWIKERIEQYDFVENRDYVVFAETGKNPLGGRPATEYHITLDMAKELSMVERTDKGKEARKYFIECERKLKESRLDFQPPRSMSEALKLAYEQALKIEEQQKAIETAAPKVNAFDTFMNAKGTQTIAEVAKALGKKMNTGPNRLFKTLREKGILMKNNLPKQEYIDCGYFEVLEKAFKKGDDPMMYAQTRVTPRGVDFISRAINGAVISA